MSRILPVLLAVLGILLPLTAVAQVPNEGLANGVVAARQKNATQLQQYNWNCRTEITQNGNLQDLRIDLVNLGPDGTPQKSLLNDQPGQLPGGFLRRAIEKGNRKNLEEYVGGLAKLLDQYTLPGAGKVIAFLVQAQVQPITSPEGKTILQVTGNGVVVPGDTFTMKIDGTSLLPISIEITTTFQGDAVTVSGTFKTDRSGLNHLQYATITVADQNLSVNIHNYDYVPND